MGKIRTTKMTLKKLSRTFASHKSEQQHLEEDIRTLSEKIAKIDTAAAKVKEICSSMIGPAKIHLRRRSALNKEAKKVQGDISWFEDNLLMIGTREQNDPTNHMLLSEFG